MAQLAIAQRQRRADGLGIELHRTLKKTFVGLALVRSPHGADV